MSKKVLIIGASIIIAALIMGGVYWLKSGGEKETSDKEAILRLGGSTTVFPFVQAAARAYMERHSEALVTISESSTGGGIKRLLAGEVDIANATRLPKEDEYRLAKERGIDFEITEIGKDAVAIIIHPSKYNFVQKLTQAQVQGIFFKGTITDWFQLHPDLSGKINVYVRDPHESGTATLFAKKITGSDKTPYIDNAIDLIRTPLVVPTLATDPNGIAYSPLKWVNRTVVVVAYGETLDKAIAPNLATISDNSYPLARKMYMITIGRPKHLTKSFIEFTLSQDGQRLLEEEGFVGK